jgi:ribosomal protein L11 methyltransferase
MAFGTGHHATTSQVIETLLDIDVAGKTVIDMGTGTGILAILASMLGAKWAVGIEIDSFAYENSLDNIALNHVDNVKLINGDASALEGLEPADIFLANINRNVITGDIDRYVRALKKGGVMILSGFYEEDIDVIMASVAPLGLKMAGSRVRDRWCCLKLEN